MGWNINIEKIPTSLKILRNHPKYKEISNRVETIEQQRVELINKINNGNTGNKG